MCVSSAPIITSQLTAPVEASSAGFTTLAANYDFSQPLYASQSNWLDCNNSNDSLPWHAGNPGIYLELPCNINQETDPLIDAKVMDFKYLTSYNSHGLSGQANTVGAQTYNLNSKTATASFPNVYIEATYRVGTEWPGGNNLSGGPNGVWTWSHGSEVIELDIGELYQDQGGFSDSGAINWSNGGGLGFFFASYAKNHLPKGFKITGYHKFGMLLTSDGKTKSYSCSFVDDILQGCKDMKINNPSAYTTRNWLISSVTSIRPPALADIDMYVQYIRAWSCESWATGMCNGSNLYGPDASGLQYWH